MQTLEEFSGIYVRKPFCEEITSTNGVFMTNSTPRSLSLWLSLPLAALLVLSSYGGLFGPPYIREKRRYGRRSSRAVTSSTSS